jgi:hypothetical protein
MYQYVTLRRIALTILVTFEKNKHPHPSKRFMLTVSLEARLKEMPTELMLLTDGDIWQQDEMFAYVSEIAKDGDVRVFPIGIGGGVSSSLIEGVARAGGGFAQMVANSEKMDNKIIRMVCTPFFRIWDSKVVCCYVLYRLLTSFTVEGGSYTSYQRL